VEQWKKTAIEVSKSVLENEPLSKLVFLPTPAFEMNKLEVRVTINHAPAAHEIFRRLAEVPPNIWARLIYPA
jgi:hypothetical protein